MRKIIAWAVVCIIFAVSLGGCGGDSEGPTPSTGSDITTYTINLSNEFRTSGYWPSGVTYDGQYLLVSNYAQGSNINIIYKYDKSTGLVRGSIPSPSQWTKNLSFDGSNIWLTDYLSGSEQIIKISKIDGSIISSVPAISSSAAHNPGGLAWEGQNLYYAESINNPNTGVLGSTIYKIDPNTGSSLGTVYKTTTYYIDGLTYKNNSLWFISTIYSGNSVTNKLVNISLAGFELSVTNLPSSNIQGLTNANDDLWYIEANSRRLVKVVP